jgi:hypothetical protein
MRKNSPLKKRCSFWDYLNYLYVGTPLGVQKTAIKSTGYSASEGVPTECLASLFSKVMFSNPDCSNSGKIRSFN